MGRISKNSKKNNENIIKNMKPSELAKKNALFSLKKFYSKHIYDQEVRFKFPLFFSPHLCENDFISKPFILCVGQYSTGKTSFIKYMVERDFPGIRIGPEPTTDGFTAVVFGKNEKLVPGHVAVARPDKPFGGLDKFGMSFLSKFQCAELDSPILNKVEFVDTPGVLAGAERSLERSYEMSKVIRWFAEKADRILLFFDANKLDISDEMKKVLNSLLPHEEKIRCILNKSDQVNFQQLMRVYGALMWNLGKVIKTPEVPRIYIGSFWGENYNNKECKELFDAEKSDLLAEIRTLPRDGAVRKINELMKRLKNLRVHCLVISHLRDKIGLFGRVKKQKKLIFNLDNELKEVSEKHCLPLIDFPNVETYRKKLSSLNLADFKKGSKSAMKYIEYAINDLIPKSLKSMTETADCESKLTEETSYQNPYENINNNSENENSKVIDPGDLFDQKNWVVFGGKKNKFAVIFDRISHGKKSIPSTECKDIMDGFNLSSEQLKAIWNCSDIDKDGRLDRDEFSLCMYLLEEISLGRNINLNKPLPIEFIPPSKRNRE